MRRACSRGGFVALLAVIAVPACDGQATGGPGVPRDEPKPPEQSTLGASDTVPGPQRPANAYGEAVLIEPRDAYAPTCSGVLIAPRVVLTAAHCVVYVAQKTWTVRAPFALGGEEVHMARDGEPMDAAFKNVSQSEYALHDLRDVAVIYADVPFENVKLPTLQPTKFDDDKMSAPAFVSAVGRSAGGAAEGLMLSATTSLEAPAPRVEAIAYATSRLTADGESGGPLFVEGTHQLVAVHAHVDASGKTDAWARLDGDVYTWMTQKVSSHGGWQLDPR